MYDETEDEMKLDRDCYNKKRKEQYKIIMDDQIGKMNKKLEEKGGEIQGESKEEQEDVKKCIITKGAVLKH